MHQDSLALRPVSSVIPTVDTTIEQTGDINNFSTIAEQGNAATDNSNADDGDMLDLLHPDDDSSVSSSEYSSDTEEDFDVDGDILDVEAGNVNNLSQDIDIISPQPLTSSLRRSTRIRKPNSRYAYHIRHYDWADNANESDFDLVLACASEAITALPSKNDALSWEPAPRSIRDILKMPEGPVNRHG